MIAKNDISLFNKTAPALAPLDHANAVATEFPACVGDSAANSQHQPALSQMISHTDRTNGRQLTQILGPLHGPPTSRDIGESGIAGAVISLARPVGLGACDECGWRFELFEFEGRDLCRACLTPGECSFFAAGIPAPGGSKVAQTYRRRDGSLVTRADGTPVIGVRDDAGKRNKVWRKVVATEAVKAMAGRNPLEGPLSMDIMFIMPRPKGHYGSGRNVGQVRESSPIYPAVKPDALKLARAVEDSLSGIAYVDDAQIVRESLEKTYGPTPGALVRVSEIGGTR